MFGAETKTRTYKFSSYGIILSTVLTLVTLLHAIYLLRYPSIHFSYSPIPLKLTVIYNGDGILIKQVKNLSYVILVTLLFL